MSTFLLLKCFIQLKLSELNLRGYASTKFHTISHLPTAQYVHNHCLWTVNELLCKLTSTINKNRHRGQFTIHLVSCNFKITDVIIIQNLYRLSCVATLTSTLAFITNLKPVNTPITYGSSDLQTLLHCNGAISKCHRSMLIACH
jgi:hypothetical protein